MKKLIPGGKYKTRPSASYFLHKLRAPLGYEIMYRKKKGGPMIKHTLQMKKGKNGPIPFWKPVEGQKHSIKRSTRRRSTRRRSTRRRSTRRRSTRRRSTRRRSTRRRSTRRRSTRRRSTRRRSTRRRSTRRRSTRRSQSGGESCKFDQSGG